MPPPLITISVVSHGQNALVNSFLSDIGYLERKDVALVVTENVPDALRLEFPPGIPAECIANTEQKGFGANHNSAFSRSASPYFCVANPDIRLRADPFPHLVQALEDPQAAVAGPKVMSPSGAVEDSARFFPTFWSLTKKFLVETRQPDYSTDRGLLAVDWIAGMFMLFRADAYREAGGFDERYFLYYEDVDLCRRLHESGRKVLYQPAAEVIHDARRGSRRSLRLARHHAASALRFLFSSRSS